MAWTFLRDAGWLTPERIRAYALILLATYAIAIGWIVSGGGVRDPAGRPVGTDFVSFWTVSQALQAGAAQDIYRPARLAAREAAADPGGHRPFYAWAYPPTALLVVYPLALLPPLPSLALWLLLGAGLYLSAVWRIVPRPIALLAGLAFPAVFTDVSHGQNALLAAALMGWALALLRQRPVASGILLGILSFKPQLGILIPLALAAGGHWRAILAAALTAAALALASAAWFGVEIWTDFRDALPFTRAMLEAPLVPYWKMQSIFAGARLLGAPVAAAWSVQILAALGAGAAVLRAWRQPIAPELRNAVLVTAGLIATPFLLDYDLMLLALPIAWLVSIGLRRGFRPWEGTALAAAFLLPLVARSLGEWTGVVIAPAVAAGLLALLMVRVRAGAASAAALRLRPSV